VGGMSPLDEGWYLMSVRDLEIELALHRGKTRTETSNAQPVTIGDALAFKAAGNIPDSLGRSLRLVLHVASDRDAARIGERRLSWEPDLHDAPSWRRDGSVPINVVPLRSGREGPGAANESWLDDPDLAALEDEWRATGAVAGVRIPADYRAFVYKTVLALRSSGRDVTISSIVDSVRRWLREEDALELRNALEDVNG
jgi:hypothetical protein